MPTASSSVVENLRAVRERISSAALRSGRAPSDITLVAVSKTRPAELVMEAVAAGQRDFGENYVQEARDKMAAVTADVRWHFIGHLQTNKSKYVAGRYALVHGVDRPELAAELGKRACAAGVVQPVLIEVKLDAAEAKGGVDPAAALGLAEIVAATPGLELRGLMAMPPFAANPEDARPHFVRLRELFEKLPVAYRHVLSMGMSGDFEVAVEEGATMVRVGTAIFGRRPLP